MGGLDASRWASGNDRVSFKSNARQAGDWDCTCRFVNYAWRHECFRCKIPRPNVLPEDRQPVSAPYLPQRKADYPESSTRNTPAPQAKQIANGLGTSRWAPRNQHGTNSTQVWTRTIPSARRSRTPSPTKAIPTLNGLRTSTPKAPDLGLPYQVQHYILATIQRIIEEGCWEFAFRWIPQLLIAKGWDCPEAVEPAEWRAFLPTALPPTAIRPLSNYTLENALADAVKIRNAAVHRHLCDNSEVRKMALQAQDLMSMFSDFTRQQKFQQLWTELNAWDSKVKESGDTFEAKAGMEKALQDIGERPIDDMDWTPNSVSLEEVHSEQPVMAHTVKEISAHYEDEDAADSMDLDY